jgi:hypothetical protein
LFGELNQNPIRQKIQEEAFPLHFEQQNATTTFFFAGLPEKGQVLAPAFAFPTKAFTSLAAFFAQLPQQTLKTTVSAAFTALPE